MQEWKLDGDRLTTTFEAGWTGEIMLVPLKTMVEFGYDDYVVSWRVLHNGAHYSHDRVRTISDAKASTYLEYMKMRMVDPA